MPDGKSLQRLLDGAFPDTAGDQYGSAVPDAIFLETLDGEVIGHVAVFRRDVLIDSRPDQLGLLGSVAVARPWRGLGLAKALIAAAHDQLRKDGIAFSVLFAFEPERYLSSGYVPMTNQTRFSEAGQYRQFVYRGGMVAALQGKPWACDILDLRGPVV